MKKKNRENIISESNADMNMNGSTGIAMSFICESALSYANGMRSSFGCMNIQNTLWLEAVLYTRSRLINAYGKTFFKDTIFFNKKH